MYMSEIHTASLTVLTGVTIYILGQLALRFFIEPYKNIRQTIEEAIYVAFAYDTVFVSILDIEDPKDYERLLDAKRAFREKGSRLIASINLFPLYSYFELFFNVPKKDDLLIGGQLLLAIGDFLGSVHNGDDFNEAISI